MLCSRVELLRSCVSASILQTRPSRGFPTLQKSIDLIPLLPSAGPTGGLGLAWPAPTMILTTWSMPPTAARALDIALLGTARSGRSITAEDGCEGGIGRAGEGVVCNQAFDGPEAPKISEPSSDGPRISHILPRGSGNSATVPCPSSAPMTMLARQMPCPVTSPVPQWDRGSLASVSSRLRFGVLFEGPPLNHQR